MTSRPYSLNDLSPAARDTAIEASRRAGLSVESWLNSAVLDSARAHGVAPMAAPLPNEFADIHSRLDSITQQIERVTGPVARPESSVARQLNDAISRLDNRLASLSPPQPTSRAANPLDAAVAEVAARQSQLDGRMSRPAMPLQATMPARSAPTPPQMPNMSGFEQQLQRLTSQIEAMRPGHIEQSIAAFREELAVIRHSITEAMPRRALETLEAEIRDLGRRIDDNRQTGTNEAALAGVEHALAEIRDTLRGLRPAEQLTGFDEAIRNLSGKLDLIVRSSEHGGVREIETAIGALRSIVSQVASGDAVARLSSDVQAIAARLEAISAQTYSDSALAAIEQRISRLTEALENQQKQAVSAPDLDGAVRALAERIDRLQVGAQDTSALLHLEQRIATMIERIELANSRPPSLGRIEEGLAHILSYLETQREGIATALNAAAAPPVAPFNQELLDTIKRDLAEMRYGQTEADRRSQISLDVVHGTLGQVVDRLASIETDLHKIKSAPAAAPVSPVVMPAAAVVAAPVAASEPAAPPVTVTQSPPLQPSVSPVHEAPRASAPASMSPVAPTLPNPAQVQMPPSGARSETRPVPQGAPARDDAVIPALTDTPRPAAVQPRPPAAQRPPIDPTLPPDHPLEPGVRPGDVTVSAAERIAASEALANGTASDAPTKVNFIAAARRAAQLAAAAEPPPKQSRMAVLKDTFTRQPSDAAPKAPKEQTEAPSKLRPILIGVSIVVLLIFALNLGMNFLSGSKNTTVPVPPAEEQAPSKSGSLIAPTGKTVASLAQPETTGAIPPAERTQKAPSALQFISPKPMAEVSLSDSRSGPVEAAPNGIPAMPQSFAWTNQPVDQTGSVTAPRQAPAVAPKAVASAPAATTPATTAPRTQADTGERLPDSIGGPKLREAALSGDAAAAYEIGSRYAEGKLVQQNYAEAAKWYDRAAQKGLVPAMFRLGSLYEKGLGVPKDLGAAKRSYISAAEGGNPKAMHNLAVLFADGGGQGPDYKTAAEWFRKASDHGLADSQYNLAVLFARGIGVEQNLVESYKWFSLAAAQGDADAGRKRDDVAKRMDPQALTAGRLAIQTYVPLAQADTAMVVAPPPGGWDAPQATQASATPAPKTTPARAKR